MGGANSWRTNITGADWMRDVEKRILSEERRPLIRTASDLLGPGFAPYAVLTQDWNAVECTFNGIFYSQPGGLNSPDGSAYWIGDVLAQQAGFGIQHVWEHRVASDPTTSPIREYIRRFYAPGGSGLTMFTPWRQVTPQPGYALGTTTAVSTTSNVDITGLSLDVTAAGTSDIFEAKMSLDVTRVAGAGTFISELLVDGIAQSGQALFNPVSTDRMTICNFWHVSNLTAGLHTFKVRARNTTGGDNFNVTGTSTHFSVQRIN